MHDFIVVIKRIEIISAVVGDVIFCGIEVIDFLNGIPWYRFGI